MQLGAELRRRGQAARAVTLTLRFPGGPALGKPRRLAEPSGHEDDLRQPTYQLRDGAGLQRGRLTGLALRGEDLVESGQVAEQLSLDAARRARLTAEGAADRIREKSGPGVIGPAATCRFSGRPRRCGPAHLQLPEGVRPPPCPPARRPPARPGRPAQGVPRTLSGGWCVVPGAGRGPVCTRGYRGSGVHRTYSWRPPCPYPSARTWWRCCEAPAPATSPRRCPTARPSSPRHGSTPTVSTS
ncbi:hypothetical protein AB0D59_46510 [Streptomyces sp. NPDC048417]|uniref:DinB/UmuC family translesion DNA polymerase n=1 Tax=Streptomyces sp. NPDC048417 TaxID=3155387 RepID=UPI003412C930